MKKIIFSALALIAFSGVCMANTIDVKEDNIQIKKANELVTPSCDQERKETYNEAVSAGYSHYQAYFQAAAVYMECMRTVGIG